MGRQISVYRTQEVEDRIIAFMLDLGLQRFEDPGGPFFGYSKPVDSWLYADLIQYSNRQGDSSQARLWTGGTGEDFLKAYETVVRFIKRNCSYDKGSGLWVWKDLTQSFVKYRNEKKRALDELVERNMEILKSWSKKSD